MYLKRKGKECFAYVQSKYTHRDGVEEYKKVNKNTYDEGPLIHYFTKDFGETFEKYPGSEFYFNEYRIRRDDSDLITVVETLGEKANCCLSELEVVEIPDDIEWRIAEYDGNEWVEEKHRIW